MTDRYFQQRIQALKNANEIKAVKANFKRKLKAMHADDAALLIADHLERDLPAIHRFSVHELLLAIPRIGQEKARRIEDATGCHPDSRIGGLRRKRERVISDRRRLLLARELRRRTDEVKTWRRLYGEKEKAA